MDTSRDESIHQQIANILLLQDEKRSKIAITAIIDQAKSDPEYRKVLFNGLLAMHEFKVPNVITLSQWQAIEDSLLSLAKTGTMTNDDIGGGCRDWAGEIDIDKLDAMKLDAVEEAAQTLCKAFCSGECS